MIYFAQHDDMFLSETIAPEMFPNQVPHQGGLPTAACPSTLPLVPPCGGLVYIILAQRDECILVLRYATIQ